MGRIIGIDLGTTNSLVCFWDQGKVTMIPNSFNEFLTPSVVSFDADGTVFVGKTAKERLITHPDSTFSNFKRYMGRKHYYECAYGKFQSEELSAFVLKNLKADAERYLGEEITEAVISVPAYFDDKARTATKKAGYLAGLNVDRIINEPSAAALGYIMENEGKTEEDSFEENSYMIFDFGGGTLDVSLVDTFENIVEIVTVSGNNQLGGIDFDKCIADHFLDVKGIDRIKITKEAYGITLSAAERVKRELTEAHVAKMVVNCKEFSAELEITDLDLANICTTVLQAIYVPVNNVLRDSGRHMEDITGIVMVGGSSKMPIVQQYLKHLLRVHEINVYEPDHIVAKGMGVYAGIKERNSDVKDMILTDVCPFSLGTNINNKMNKGRDLASVIIARNSPLPISRTSTYYPTNDNQTNVLFKLFQGEELYAEDNKRIGSIDVVFPKPVSKSTEIKLTFTYDINGILLVNADVPEYNIHMEKVILDQDDDENSARVKDIVGKLKAYKAATAEDEDTVMIREWGERLYAQLPMEMKGQLEQRLLYFEYLNSKDPYQAQKMKKHLKQYYLTLEILLNSYTVSAWQFDPEWEEEEDNEMERLFKAWEQGQTDDDDDGDGNKAE